MMSDFLILFIIFFTLVLGTKNKINCFDSFLVGVKDGIKISVNMFPNLLVFMIALSFLLSSGLLDYINELLNFEYSLIVVQSFVRPFSSSASLSIMLEMYNNYGVDSKKGLMSAMIHYVSDASLYLIPFYCGVYNIKKYDKILVYGIIVNIFSYLIAILVVIIFCK